MSGSSEVNLKQTLRKIEYPLCAQEALKKIGELLCSRTANIKSMDLSLDLMAEFVFWEVDRRGNKKPHSLNAIVELQLIDILFDYLSHISNEASRNTLFLNLFSPITANMRLGILSKLVSLAVGIPNSNILMSTSTWMQQLGSTSVSSCKLAENLVFDYFHLVSHPEERLRNLPNIAAPFVANFLTAVAENYYEPKKNRHYPSDSLLICITKWIFDNISLCMAAQQRQAMLPPGAIPMEATTPFAGLIRWCVLAPIYDQNKEIYNKLLLGLLQSISEIPKTNPPRAISVQHLTAILTPLIQYFRELKSRETNDKPLQLALDRFGHAIQISISANAVYGHLDELFNSLNNLPFNRLLSIVIERYKQSKEPVIII